METNFETQAAAAVDLGGIEISRNRLVITIGLGTITHNKNAAAIIIAAGEAKAPIVQQSLESAPDVKYPATVLQRLKNSRFYLTKGASKTLTDTENDYWEHNPWDSEKEQRALLKLAKNKNTFGKKLLLTFFDTDLRRFGFPPLIFVASDLNILYKYIFKNVFIGLNLTHCIKSNRRY